MKEKPKKGILFWGILVLIPILVVIPSLPHVGKGPILRANQTKALAVCTELEQAILRFYDDNGTLPADIVEDSVFSSNSTQGLEMLRVLMNQEAADPPLSAKGIKYLSIKQGDRNNDGWIWSESGTQITGLYDPWGGSYMIALDGDFDESIDVQPKAAKESQSLQHRVAVWSNGQDPDKANDDVTSWQP